MTLCKRTNKLFSNHFETAPSVRPDLQDLKRWLSPSTLVSSQAPLLARQMSEENHVSYLCQFLLTLKKYYSCNIWCIPRFLHNVLLNVCTLDCPCECLHCSFFVISLKRYLQSADIISNPFSSLKACCIMHAYLAFSSFLFILLFATEIAFPYFLVLVCQTPVRRWWRSTMTGSWCSARPYASRLWRLSHPGSGGPAPAVAPPLGWVFWGRRSPATSRLPPGCLPRWWPPSWTPGTSPSRGQ